MVRFLSHTYNKDLIYYKHAAKAIIDTLFVIIKQRMHKHL